MQEIAHPRVAHGVTWDRVLVVLPTYNERENLDRLVGELLRLRPSLDVLVVDDGSPDGTGRLADRLAARSHRVKVLHRPRKLGLGTAYVAGFRWGLARTYSTIVQMDADFSHRPADLKRLLAASEQHEVVLGSRYVPGGAVEGWPWLRRVISRGGSLYARLILGGGPRDYTGGFKVFRSSVLARLDLDRICSNGYAFQVEVNYACRRAGFDVAEVPIRFPERQQGRSKMSARIAAEAAFVVPRLRLGLIRPALRELRPAAQSR